MIATESAPPSDHRNTAEKPATSRHVEIPSAQRLRPDGKITPLDLRIIDEQGSRNHARPSHSHNADDEQGSSRFRGLSLRTSKAPWRPQ